MPSPAVWSRAKASIAKARAEAEARHAQHMAEMAANSRRTAAGAVRPPVRRNSVRHAQHKYLALFNISHINSARAQHHAPQADLDSTGCTVAASSADGHDDSAKRKHGPCRMLIRPASR